ncbi:putative 2-dehydropantoate 2-reductase [Nocardia nova SH22a]|uniref:Putative 2-dehydropantoate 2-reductase n=1 Tax=Nocardia nova SH22a TaxID=1415166 RepID=W5TLF2_9NOCA|nr:2-dehydropantoate 2-reductase N-terminal domain-containing protein [Nocardia nova]AHH19959.1 putative 2-dehydropantoate 2-reductase [Nocardia nova SH22a]
MTKNMQIAVLGAGSIGSLFASKLAAAGHDVTLVVRNDARRAYLQQHGLVARSRLSGRARTVPVQVISQLRSVYDLVIVAVQRPQIETLIPLLADNESRAIMFMFNCASGADRWADEIGPERLLWGFPAALADMRDQVLEYVVVPRFLRFTQITTIGRIDGRSTPELHAIRNAFDRSGIPTVVHDDIDAWLKTHAAYMAPIMAMGYVPRRGGMGPRFTRRQARELATAMQAAFTAVRATGAHLTPANMRLFDRLSTPVLTTLLWTVFCMPMAKRSLDSHSGAAPREVAVLLDELAELAARAGTDATPFMRLAGRVPARV